tara:strand:+ start:15 stop:527 length:513 start_codon:yes stop_codon:yes gene_type:complete
MKNIKGFTLIELLVVVAIIGILAAVGTVAYTGYTEGAKKNSAKSNHAAVVKYIAAEDQKCTMQANKVFGFPAHYDETADSTAAGTNGAFNCKNRTGDTITTAAVAALSDFKNPYSTGSSAVRDGSAHAASADMGFVNVSAVDDTITVTTCFQNKCAATTDDVTNDIEVAE